MKTIAKQQRNPGKIFEDKFHSSCKKENIWFFNIKDTFIPFDLRGRIKTSRNEYDCLIFHNKRLFPIELKSTDKKSFSFAESIIKEHQIDNLHKAGQYKDVIPGFLFNFRNENNNTYFIHINDFVAYKHIAENQLESPYKSKINRSSIPISICKEIGTEVLSVKKRVHYHYFVGQLASELIAKEQLKDNK